MSTKSEETDAVRTFNPDGSSPVLLICEHASHAIPGKFQDLRLTPDARYSHIAWDPGALDTAMALSAELNAKLVFSSISRLVYDCNRPPDAPDAMPEKSEIYTVPGNHDLTEREKAERVEAYYRPFESALSEIIDKSGKDTVLVTIHTFTPVYKGRYRDCEIGILHDDDKRLANAMLSIATRHTKRKTLRNEPYGPQDGVTHTLRRHGLSNGLLNVMIELRNDLVATEESAQREARILAGWIAEAIEVCECKVA
jgi:predicted N-formylglutamate amidohydrolase